MHRHPPSRPVLPILLLAAAVLNSASVAPAAPAAAQDERTAIHLPLGLRDVSLRGAAAPAPAFTPDADFVLGGPAWAVDTIGDVAFVAIGAHVVALDVHAEDGPVVLGASPPLPGDVHDVVARGGHVFAAVAQNTVVERAPGGLYVLDVRDVTAPTVVGVAPVRGGISHLAVEGPLAVGSADPERVAWGLPIGDSFEEAAFFDVSDPRAPRLLDERFAPHRDAALVGGRAFVCDEIVHVVDAALAVAGRSPVRVQRAEGDEDVLPCDRVAAWHSGDRLVVAVGRFDGRPDVGDDVAMLSLVDVEDAEAARVLGRLLPAEPGDVPEGLKDPVYIDAMHVAGDRVWLTGAAWDGRGHLVAVDWSEPDAPRVLADQVVASWPLAVAASTHGAVVAGVRHDAGEMGVPALIEENISHVLGAHVETAQWQPDGAITAGGALIGMGGLPSALSIRGDRALLLEYEMAADDIALHEVDLAAPWLRLRSSLRLLVEPGLGDWSASPLAQSDAAAFAMLPTSPGATEGLLVIDLRADEPTHAATLPHQAAALAAGERHLFVLDERGLYVYDTRDPAAPRAVASLPDDMDGEPLLALHGDVLWAARSAPPYAVRAIDVSRPAAPSVLATLALDGRLERVDGLGQIVAHDGGAALTIGEPWADGDVIVAMLELAEDRASLALVGATPASDAFERRLDPLALTTLAGRAWLATSTMGGGEAGGGFDLLGWALRAGADAEPLVRPMPAAVAARSSVFFEDIIEERGSLNLGRRGTRLLGTDVEGGFFAVRP